MKLLLTLSPVLPGAGLLLSGVGFGRRPFHIKALRPCHTSEGEVVLVFQALAFGQANT
jgi:hypothetical protein